MDSQHREKLQRHCRICNKILLDNERFSKSKFKEEIQLVFKVDIDKDSENIHPPFLCSNHKTLMHRARKCYSTSKSFSTNVSLHNFEEHSDNCSICFQSPCITEHSYSSDTANPNVGRPLKRKAGPGRGHEGQTKVYLSSTESVTAPDIQPNDQILSSFNQLESVEKLCFLQKLIQNLTEDERAFLAFELGGCEMGSVNADCQNIKVLYTDLDFLKSKNDFQAYVQNRNKTVVSFLKGVTGANNDSDKSMWYQLCHILESIYGVNNSCLVAPVSFLHNLVAYSISGSKSVATLNATTGPYGSYKTINSWLDKMACTTPECPEGCIVSVFDNDQVIGRRYQVTPNNKVKTSVITNCAWIQLDKDGSLQKQYLLPHNWFSLQGFEETIIGLRDDTFAQHETLEDIHYEQLFYILDGVIKAVTDEHKFEQGSYTDHIDDLVADKTAAEGHRPCPNCGALVKKGKRYCDNPNCNIHLRSAREAAEEPEPAEDASKTPKFRKINFKIDEKTNSASCRKLFK